MIQWKQKMPKLKSKKKLNLVALSSILLSSIKKKKNSLLLWNRKLPKPLGPSRCPKLTFCLCQGGKNNFYCLKKIKENIATLSFLSHIPKHKAKQKTLFSEFLNCEGRKNPFKIKQRQNLDHKTRNNYEVWKSFSFENHRETEICHFLRKR